jgi:hypothetical protein
MPLISALHRTVSIISKTSNTLDATSAVIQHLTHPFWMTPKAITRPRLIGAGLLLVAAQPCRAVCLEPVTRGTQHAKGEQGVEPKCGFCGFRGFIHGDQLDRRPCMFSIRSY